MCVCNHIHTLALRQSITHTHTHASWEMLSAGETESSHILLLHLQLRELVPGNANSTAAHEGADSKRPKHVVLSDTIALVKELQGKVRQACFEAYYLNTTGQDLAVTAKPDHKVFSVFVVVVVVVVTDCVGCDFLCEGAPGQDMANVV